MPDGLTGPPKKGALMVGRCGNGDIIEQFSRVHSSATPLEHANISAALATIDIGSKYPIEAPKRLLIFP
jgi:hypothetical protein